MKKRINWFNVILITATAGYLIDLYERVYLHPANNIPNLRYTIIGLTGILFLFIVNLIISKRRSKK